MSRRRGSRFCGRTARYRCWESVVVQIGGWELRADDDQASFVNVRRLFLVVGRRSSLRYRGNANTWDLLLHGPIFCDSFPAGMLAFASPGNPDLALLTSELPPSRHHEVVGASRMSRGVVYCSSSLGFIIIPCCIIREQARHTSEQVCCWFLFLSGSSQPAPNLCCYFPHSLFPLLTTCSSVCLKIADST